MHVYTTVKRWKFLQSGKHRKIAGLHITSAAEWVAWLRAYPPDDRGVGSLGLGGWVALTGEHAMAVLPSSVVPHLKLHHAA